LRVAGVQAGGVGEGDGDPEPGQLVQDQHLVGVGTGQPVRGQAADHLEQPGLGGIAQRIQPGPVQPGPGMPVVAVLPGRLVAGGGQPVAQRLQLGADGAPLGLPLGGHPRVDRGLDDHLPISCAAGTAGAAAASSRNW
jgi:hypothetical protein